MLCCGTYTHPNSRKASKKMLAEIKGLSRDNMDIHIDNFSLPIKLKRTQLPAPVTVSHRRATLDESSRSTCNDQMPTAASTTRGASAHIHHGRLHLIDTTTDSTLDTTTTTAAAIASH